MNKSEIFQELRDSKFLQNLEDADIDRIASASRCIDLAEGEIIFREGESATEIFLVRGGNVSLEICAPSFGCKRIMTAGDGELLGWSPVLDGTPLAATARTLTPTSLVAIDATQLLAICAEHPRVGYDFMRCMARAIARRLNATRLQLLDVYGEQPACTAAPQLPPDPSGDA